MVNIVFFTEMGFVGKIPRNHPNMRTEFAWMCSLNADHYNLQQTPQKHYDLGIVITPKNKPNIVDIDRLRQFCDKIAMMQEGPFWYFQDYPLENQIHYYNNLVSVDIIYVHKAK